MESEQLLSERRVPLLLSEDTKTDRQTVSVSVCLCVSLPVLLSVHMPCRLLLLFFTLMAFTTSSCCISS